MKIEIFEAHFDRIQDRQGRKWDSVHFKVITLFRTETFHIYGRDKEWYLGADHQERTGDVYKMPAKVRKAIDTERRRQRRLAQVREPVLDVSDHIDVTLDSVGYRVTGNFDAYHANQQDTIQASIDGGPVVTLNMRDVRIAKLGLRETPPVVTEAEALKITPIEKRIRVLSEIGKTPEQIAAATGLPWTKVKAVLSGKMLQKQVPILWQSFDGRQAPASALGDKHLIRIALTILGGNHGYLPSMEVGRKFLGQVIDELVLRLDTGKHRADDESVYREYCRRNKSRYVNESFDVLVNRLYNVLVEKAHEGPEEREWLRVLHKARVPRRRVAKAKSRQNGRGSRYDDGSPF